METQDIEKLIELRGLLAKATPGPWFQGYGADNELWNGDSESRHNIWPDELGVGRIIARTGCHFTGWMEQPDADAALIVAAVNALPNLLDTITNLRARAETLEEGLREIAAMADDGKLNWGHAQDAIDIARALIGKDR